MDRVIGGQSDGWSDGWSDRWIDWFIESANEIECCSYMMPKGTRVRVSKVIYGWID